MSRILLRRQLGLKNWSDHLPKFIMEVRKSILTKENCNLSFKKLEDFHDINYEPNAFVLSTLEESKTKMKKYVLYILLCLCAHLHFTEVTGNELLLVHWEKQRERPPSRRGHNDVTQSAVFWDICYVDNPDRCFSSKKQNIWHNSFHSLWSSS